MQKGTLHIKNKYGLHARAAMKLVDLSGHFTAEIYIIYNGRMIDAKDMMAVLALGAKQGTELELMTQGEEYEKAFEAVKNLFERQFDEP